MVSIRGAHVWGDSKGKELKETFSILFGTAFAVDGALPPPKWQTHRTKQRLSMQELIRQLPSEVWAYAIDQLDANPNNFVTERCASTKSSKLHLPVTSASSTPTRVDC